MKTRINIITALTSLFITANALAGETEAQQHHIFVTTHKGEIGEVCPELKTGQTLSFEFEANNEIEFNLHYHEGEKVTYPIKVQTLKSITQSFKAPIDQTYCLMWKGLNEQPSKVKIKYSIISQ